MGGGSTLGGRKSIVEVVCSKVYNFPENTICADDLPQTFRDKDDGQEVREKIEKVGEITESQVQKATGQIDTVKIDATVNIDMSTKTDNNGYTSMRSQAIAEGTDLWYRYSPADSVWALVDDAGRDSNSSQLELSGLSSSDYPIALKHRVSLKSNLNTPYPPSQGSPPYSGSSCGTSGP